MIDRIAERLTKLLLMLSSDRDGEVIAAARAIGRALKNTGADWHALAARLSAPAKASAPPHHDTHDDDWHEMREFCLQHSELLRSRELEFIENLAEWQGDLTVKQHDWLIAIYARIRRAT